MSDYPAGQPAAPIAYLTSEYPAVSHTFILREVEALRALGRNVLTCSIRRTGPEHHRGPAEQAAVSDTYYILEAATSFVGLLGGLGFALGRPRRLVAALGLAWRSRPPGLRALLYQLLYLAEAMVLARHLHGQGVVHLHNHFGNASATVAMLAGALADIPFSYTLHGPVELFEPKMLALAHKTAAARFVACISHFCRSQAMLFSDPAHWPKLRIIHCGVLPEAYDRPKTPPAPDQLRLLFVGRLSPIKGVRILIEALAHVQRDHPGVTLTLVGDGEDRAILEDLARPLGDAGTFAGFKSQEEVADALVAADVLVLPSFAEGLPVVLMEALASRTPVICTQLAGVGELVEHGVSGYIVPAGDAEGLAHAVSQMAADPERRASMGDAGRARVLAEFDIRDEAARIAALFDGTGGTGPRPAPVSDVR